MFGGAIESFAIVFGKHLLSSNFENFGLQESNVRLPSKEAMQKLSNLQTLNVLGSQLYQS